MVMRKIVLTVSAVLVLAAFTFSGCNKSTESKPAAGAKTTTKAKTSAPAKKTAPAPAAKPATK